jgi:hypothetical protein
MKLVTSVISGDASGSGVCVADGAASMKGVVVRTDTQRMLFHVPDGASGTVARSVAAAVDVGVPPGAAVAAAEAEADADTNADVVPIGLASGRTEAEPLAVGPTQPAATNAVSATIALHLLQPRPMLDLVPTACPSGRSTMRRRVCDAIVAGRVMGPATARRLTA